MLNNFSHESVGGQKTNSENLNFRKVTEGSGYKKYFLIKNKNQITKILKKFLKCAGPSFLEVRIKNKSINNLERPKNLINIKNNFMKN